MGEYCLLVLGGGVKGGENSSGRCQDGRGKDGGDDKEGAIEDVESGEALAVSRRKTLL